MIAISSIPALVSAIFMFSLGMISLFGGKLERVNIIFSLYAFALGAAALTSFLFFESPQPESAAYLLKFPALFAISADILIIYYVLILTGYIRELSRKFLGVSLRTYLVALVSFGVLLAALCLFTDQIIDFLPFSALAGHRECYGPLFYPLVFGFSLFSLAIFILLHKAYRRATCAPERINLRCNLVGFYSLYIQAGIMLIYLPLWGVESYAYAFVPFTIAAIIFYLAIVRYQFSQIEELNRGLERKVVERTRELKRTQARLAEEEKMAALVRLVAGLAHEINNPLGALLSNNDSIRRSVAHLQNRVSPAELERNGKLFMLLDKLSRANYYSGKRIEHLVSKLKSFAHLDEAEVQMIDINEAVETTLSVLHHQIKEQVEVDLRLEKLPPLLGKANHFNQAIMHLLDNALEAIDGRGRIFIHTRSEEDSIIIEVSDDGRGIPEAHRNKIFDPGFTTKGSGVGAGLGLSIARQVIKDHQGEIFLKSEEGRGTTIRVELPFLTQEVSIKQSDK